MADQVIGITIKGIGDFSDVVSNVNNVQKALTKLKLPDKLGNSLSKNISDFTREYDKYQKKISEGIKTQGDQNAVDKSLNSMMNSYRAIINDFSKLSLKDFKEIFNLDAGAFAPFQKRIKEIQSELEKIKLDPKQIADPMAIISKLTKAKPFDKLKEAFATNDLAKAKEAIQDIETYYTRFSSKMSQPKRDAMGPEIEKLKTVVKDADSATEELSVDMEKVNQVINNLGGKAESELKGMSDALKNSADGAEKVTDALKKQHAEEFGFNRQVQDIDRQIQSYFGLSQMIRKVGDIARDAFNTVKELDAAMTETAVVTNFSVGDMWNMLPTYTEQANQLGAAIKDVYEATTLYYQQGLNTDQAMGLSEETLKMARIAGLDAAEATDMMTAALRGFNMEINQASAQKINDIYSQLAAVTASDTREIGTAMEKTASLASSAGMEVGTTSAFLAQMIETTREAPENLGTAMKTIIARFQEMKKDPTKLVDAEGVAMDVNKIDTALKTIGVQLTNTKGEFRDLDDVFLDISAKWDSLSQGQQRYIATTAAGSRQQSRFIAMMSNYDRTMELVNEANNSAGASQKQFEKTMDSMSSKLNQLKNAWDQFTMGLMNNQILKTGVTGLTQFFTIVNKIISALSSLGGKISDPFGGMTKSVLTLVATLGGLNFGKKLAGGAVSAGVGWWKNEGSLGSTFMKGYGTPKREKVEDITKRKFEQLEERRKAKEIVKTDIKVEAGNVDTSDVSNKVKTKVKQDVEDDPPVEVNRNIKTNPKNPSGQESNTPGWRKQAENRKAENYNPKPIEETGKAASNAADRFTNLGNNIANTGFILQSFGDKLGPLGGIFSAVGSAMVSFGTTISSIGMAISTAMAEGAAFGAALWSIVWPIAAVAAAATALFFIVKEIDKATETNAERMERFTDTANNASDAYNTLKQEASELNSTLDEIQNNEEAFSSLVAGTAEFNDKLTESNQKIDELLQKYPELNDPKFLSTDKNGLKHINQKGIDFIKKQQEQRVGNAAAQNTIQNARLKAEENRQKAAQKEKKIASMTQPIQDIYRTTSRERKLSDSEKDEVKNLEAEAKYLRESADNAERLAIQQGLASSFTNVEVKDREKMASIYADNYDAIKKQVEAQKASKEEMAQAYATYYGYDYDAASKKVTDSSGQEVKEDTIKNAYSDIVATVQLQASAESLDKIEDDVNQRFSEGLNLGSSRGDNVLSGVLSGDIETNPELVKKLAEKTPEQIKATLQDLSDAEMAALMGIKESDFANNRDALRTEFANSIKDNAQKTLEAQSQVYKDLGVKMAKTQNVSFNNRDYEVAVNRVADEISKLTVEQANTLNTIGQQLEENVGLDTMGTFLEKASSIYAKNNTDLTNDFNNILEGINWESPASRLAGYTKAVNSSRTEIQEFGHDMKNSVSEANILGDAFDEFLGGDWTELSENADEFKNSLGEIDGAGILKVSEQSQTLKSLLDSGQVSANGVAMALQGIEEGKYSIGEVDSVVLQLLSSLNRLEDASLRAHNIIEGFDPGIDTGEGEDFVKENAGKAQEYFDNGEWGNEQLQNYIKLAAGEERWNKTLRKNKGDYEATTKSLMKYVNTFKDGFGPAWDQMVKGESIGGKSLDKKIKEFAKGDKDLEERFGQFKAFYEDGNLKFNFGDLSTKELETYFEKIYGVSKDYATLLTQDLLNYSGDIKADLQKNDLKETVRSDEFKNARQGFGNNEKPILTDAELKIFQDAGGDLHELATAAGYKDTKGKDGKTVTAEEQLKADQFRVYGTGDKKDQRRTDYSGLLQDYAETFKTGKHTVQSLFGVKDLQTNGKLDLNKLIADTSSKSFDEEQSMQAAFKAYTRGQELGKATLYDGMEVEGGLKTFEDFKASIQKMTETSQWVQVGETIGAQIVNALNGSSFLESMRQGKEGAAVTDTRQGYRFNEDNFNNVIDKIRDSGEDKKQQQADISEYLKQSQEQFSKMNPEQQNLALQSIVSKLGELNFTPEQIGKTINDGLGTALGVNGSIVKDENGQITYKPQTEAERKTQQERESTTTTSMEERKAKIEMEVDDKAVEETDKKVDQVTSKKREEVKIGTDNSKIEETEKKVDDVGKKEVTVPIKAKPVETEKAVKEVTTEAKKSAESTPKENKTDRKQTVINTITLNSTVANPKEPEEKVKNTLPKSVKGKVNASITVSASSIKTGGIKDKIQSKLGEAAKSLKVKTNTTSTVKTKAKVEGKKNVDDLTKSIKAVKPKSVNVKASTSGKSTVDSLKNAIDNLHDKTINIRVKKTGDQPHTGGLMTSSGPIYRARGGLASNPMFKREGTDTIPAMLTPGEYVQNRKAVQYFGVDFMRRINHRDLTGALNSFGSAAKGHYGTIGPKDKGGPTLTGEKGFEIAWLPSENRSMILGANGPQMIDLPSDAVVWTHEQSKKILAQKAIPAGSHAEKSTSGRRAPETTQQTQTKNPSGGGNKGGKGNKGGGKKDKTTKQTEKNTKEASKIIEKAGKISVWWENQTRKVDAVQRKVDKASKTFEKAITNFGATFKSVGKSVNDYISKLNASIKINQTSYDKATKDLKKLDKGSATKKQKAAIKSAKAQVKAAKKTKKNKKDDKAAKKALNTAYLNAGYESISWDVTQKTTKKDKKGKKKTTSKKVTKEGYVDLSKYIKYDSATGAYVVDPNAISKVAKKNKSKAKAISEAANKKIDEAQGRKNTAEDNIIKSREALEELGKKLYETFLSWEIELTKIWNITQKITDLENKTSRLKEYTSLREAQINSGMVKANKSFIGESSRLFNAQLKSMGQSINARAQQINLQKNEIKDLLLGTSNQATLANVNQKLNANADAAAKKSVVNNKQNQVNAINQQIKSLKQERTQYEKNLANQRKAEEQAIIAQQKAMAAEKKGKRTSKLQTGVASVSTGSQSSLMGGISRTSQQIDQLQSQLKIAEVELKTAQNAYNQISKNVLDSSQLTLYQQQQKALQEDEAIRKRALSYMNSPVQNADGTVSISFDTDRFKNDQQTLGITSEDATKIQNYVKKIQEANDELNKEYVELTQSLSELYETLEDLRKQQADDAEELLSITEEENKKQLEELKDLSDSITDAIKDLLNEVKERLTERRNREDNAKTEQDISKKQQRLAALQADTSGGNAVEIAQLQKEIADAQQSYERTLEDQLLDRLQKQADDAARQREIMIELQQALLESSEKTSNLAQVNHWLDVIENYQRGDIDDKTMEAVWEEIREKYYSNKDYNSVTAAQQKIIETDFESLKERLGSNATNQKNTKTAIEGATGSLDLLKTSIEDLTKAINGEKPVNPAKPVAKPAAKSAAKPAAQPVTQSTTQQKADAEARAAVQRAQEEDMRRQDEAQRLKDYQTNYKNVLAQVTKDKQLSAAELLMVKDAANALGYGADTYFQHLANTSLSWKQVIEAAKGAKYNKDRMAATFNSSAFIAGFDAVYGKDAYKKRNKSAKKYATGGLADYTGPAWLDGTPSKPELVLNSRDTKNFLALRDVLGNVMGTVNSRDESYNSVNEFNININVDQIANDYDVDRMVERVKKDIIKSANYRNVTQIRSFR